jgi:hypothetical protein
MSVRVRARRWSPALLLAMLTATLLMAGPTSAIIGGELDGDQHPGVGFMIGYDAVGDPLYGCSGTLVSETVFVTAAHCTGGEPDLIPVEVRVVFDSRVPLGPDGIPDPSAYVVGEPHPNPAFVHGGSELGYSYSLISEDYGVVILDRDASEVFPAVTTTAITSLELDKKTVNKLTFELVGYGLSAVYPKGNFKDLAFDGNRRNSMAEGKGDSLLDPSVLYLNANPNGSDDANGTIASGDSGGAVLANDTLVGVISASLGHKSYAARLDTPSAKVFLAQFLGD